MRAYLYHKTKEPMIVHVNDMSQHVEWEESPLSFVKTTDFGVDPEDKIKVHLLGETIEGVKDCCNGLLNLDLMNMKELREFASKYFRRIKGRSKKALITNIEAHNGNSSRYN